MSEDNRNPIFDDIINRLLTYWENQIQKIMAERGLAWEEAADIWQAEVLEEMRIADGKPDAALT